MDVFLMSEEFQKCKIKAYKHWEVYLHTNQYYLGRTYIWVKRKEAVDLMAWNLMTKDGVKTTHPIITISRLQNLHYKR